MDFTHPEPCGPAPAVYPLFIPFAGCAQRCIFCAQTAQTGRAEGPVIQALAGAEQDLKLRSTQGKAPVELAFYGGTFSALAPADQLACLRLGAKLRDQGLVCGLRCSTRPDALAQSALDRFKEYGLSTVELGIQSFADRALLACRRGYSGSQARDACKKITDQGFTLGIQLLPGLPGSSHQDFLKDVENAAVLTPAFARLYPCMVLEGTELAELWRRGEYRPWDLESCLELLAQALTRLWRAKIKVIRIGLAQEPGLAQNILAGPVHPALGSRARALALFGIFREVLAAFGKNPQAIYCPRRFQGEIWGQGGELKSVYAKLDFLPEKLHWWSENYFRIL